MDDGNSGRILEPSSTLPVVDLVHPVASRSNDSMLNSSGFNYSSHNSTSVGAFFQTLKDSLYWYNGKPYSLDVVRKVFAGLHLLFLCSGLPRDGDVNHCCI